MTDKKTNDDISNIAAHLPRMASLQPFMSAVVFPEGRNRQGEVCYSHYTFQQLDRVSDQIAAGFLEMGIGHGMRTVLMVTPSLDFFALTFALFKIGAVSVMIDPGMGIKNLKQCIQEAAPEAFIGVPKAHVARVLFRWGKETLKHLVTVVARGFTWGDSLEKIKEAGGRRKFEMAENNREDMAAILFTSGSTGVPKGVVYTHNIFINQVEKLKEIYGIQPGEIDLPTFPLFALFAPALGMTAIIPDMDATRPATVDSRKIIEAIEDFGVTNMFGSPALIRRVGRYGSENGIRLPSLKRVISAGAPVPGTTLKMFSEMLSAEAQIFTPYGATEALPVCSIGSHEILRETASLTDRGKGVCIGKPVASIEVQIIGLTDDAIEKWSDDLKVAPGEVGEITVRGSNVTQTYFHRDASTRLAKMRTAGTDEVYHRMGDLGYWDEQGRIWFCGRKAHRVVLAEETLFTIPCEGVFNAHPHVFRSALVGVKKDGGTIPVICIELEKDSAGKVGQDELQTELLDIAQKHEITGSIRTLLFHPAFPVDIRHNAKIFREKLAVWATQQLKS